MLGSQKWTYISETSQLIFVILFFLFLRHSILDFHYLEGIIITGFKYFTLCEMNLCRIWVSPSELSDKEILNFSMRILTCNLTSVITYRN